MFVYGHGLMPICRPCFFYVRTWVNAHLLFVFWWTWVDSQLLSFAVCGHGLIPICRPLFGEPGLMPSCCSPLGSLGKPVDMG
jgi:hypothetical protein